MAGEGPKGQKRARPGRATMSCDRCKARKTKCIRPDHGGPCNYCRNASHICSIDMTKRRVKPFYFVSEEEYRLLHKLCQRTFPDEDLSLENLRVLVSRTGNQPLPTSPSEPQDQTPGSSMDKAKLTGTTANTPAENDDVLLPEIVGLHKDLGCLMADAQGEYRYMGAESGAGFNIAVRDWVTKTQARSPNREIMPTWIRAMLPGTKLRPTASGSFPMDPSVLPPQDVVLACASSYFEQVHSMYWLYSSEDFYSRLEATYTSEAPYLRTTDSWLCSLHSIVAMTASCIPISDGNPDEQLAHTSLAKAKLLTSKVCDEADLDSIRAITLLALALRSHGSPTSAYLHIGMASRIAFSLGLHLDKHPSGVVTKEHARRLWWSLYLLDQDISLQSGKPGLSAASNGCAWNPPLPSEKIVSPGLHTPHEYLEHCVSLACLTHSIRQSLYIGPIQEGHKLRQSDFETAMQSLESWHASIPHHLHLVSSSQVAPCHRRPIALLHLRYWEAVLLVTRPFLLCIILRGDKLGETSKLKYLEGVARTCISASETALEILETMVSQNTVSSMVMYDYFVGLQVMQVGLIASGLFGPDRHDTRPGTYLNVLASIGKYGFPKQLLPETLYQLQKFGLKDERIKDLVAGDLCHNEALSDRALHDLGDTSMYNPLLQLDLPHDAIDDLNFLDVNVDEDFMEQLMQLSGTFSPSQNALGLLAEPFLEIQ